ARESDVCTAEMSYEHRRSIVVKNRLCFKCRAKNHMSRGCSAHVSCDICRKSHLSIMHDDKYVPGAYCQENRARQTQPAEMPLQSGQNVTVATSLVNFDCPVLLQTAAAEVLASDDNRRKRIRVFF